LGGVGAAWSRSGACWEDALAEAVEGGWAVGAALGGFDLVVDSFGVAVGGWLVEVGERLLAPEPNAVGEGVEGGDLGPVDGGGEAVEAALGLVSVLRSVDRPEGFLEAPGLGQQRLAFERLAEPPPLALCEPLAGL
jgi:hypothetical protein